MAKQIEVEYRSRITEEQYKKLIEFLNTNAKDLGEDDKRIHFYVFPDKLLKVTDNISQNSAKITLKLNKIGKGALFEELEMPIPREDVEKSARIFDALGFTENHLIEPIVKRHNFLYKGVELAVKYSESWQYHVELEIVIDDAAKHAEAEQAIRAVAEDLRLIIMTDTELTEFTNTIEENYRKKHTAII